ncbi:MAG: tetratricopeptide repeat protein [Alphaproteobacteria bacterium]|nr:tetratricopeptide repeat protein [Alphaproteobacteria bacterium]
MPPSPLHQERLRQGHALQMQGRLGEAADIYRAVLAEDPQNAPALHLLGVLVMQAGQIEPGLELVRQSLTILPNFAPAQENLGKGLEQLGRDEEALAAYDRLVKLAPGHAEGYAHRSRILERLVRFSESLKDIDKALSLKSDPALMLNRGAILLQLQRPKEALATFDKAIAAGLQHPVGFFNRGVALTALGRPDDALASYDEAILRQPDYADAFVNRGLVLESLDRPEEALASYDRALHVNPTMPEAASNRVALLARLGRRAEALTDVNTLIAEQPDNAMAYNNRGSVLKNMGEMQAALADFDKAIALAPDVPMLHSNRAVALHALGDFEVSLAAFDRALALDGNSASTKLNKAFLLLLLGRLEEGLPLYENRLRPGAPLDLDVNQAWKGPSQSVAGKTVLIFAEQGMGDVMLFSRYLIQLSALGARVVLAVRDSIARLLRSLPVPVTFIPEYSKPKTLDYYASLLSLPLLFGTRQDTIPAPVPYLAAEADRVTKWRKRLGGHGVRVAIAWQGKTKGTADAERSFPVAALAPLAKLAGVRLISLQKGEGSEQLDHLPEGMVVERPGDDLDAGFDAFIDSAAVMQACDLVITLDSSIAHLAGALGRPTWTALKSVPEWRWFTDRTDSPWYPTMTLYRQPRFKDWDSVFAAMTRDLERKLASRSA